MTRSIAFIVKDQHPVTLTRNDTVQHACQRMWKRRVGAVLVTGDKGALCGIFTGRDAVHALGQAKDPAATPLSAVMTPDPRTIPPDRTAVDALRMMNDYGFRHLPVVRDDKIIGIVSRGDFTGTELDRVEGETLLWERIA
jgi:CBS domain-containing protein